MTTLQGPVIYGPAVGTKDTGSHAFPANCSSAKARLVRSGFWGCGGRLRVGTLSPQQYKRRDGAIQCSFSSSSDDSGSMAENFSESDEEYVNSVVIEAVEVRSGADGFIIKMRDGQHLRCVHNSHQGGHLPDYAPHPAIILKMEDGSDLLLPIIVLEMPSVLLMAAICNVQIARPTVYQVINEMIEKMGYTVRLVRVTKRVNEAYFSRLYLTKIGDETDKISIDLRPSDAINIAVRCKVPIQVNKLLVFTDGMRIVEPSKYLTTPPISDGLLFTERDRPDGQPCMETIEFNLVRNMLVAVVEERYKDAAQWRDKLYQLRSKKRNWT